MAGLVAEDEVGGDGEAGVGDTTVEGEREGVVGVAVEQGPKCAGEEVGTGQGRFGEEQEATVRGSEGGQEREEVRAEGAEEEELVGGDAGGEGTGQMGEQIGRLGG